MKLSDLNKCEVKDCKQKATYIYRPNPSAPLEAYQVCNFHYIALKSGEPFSVNEKSEMILGSMLPPEVINAKYSEGTGDPVITLELGHDGIKESTVKFRIPEHSARLWLDAMNDIFHEGEPSPF